MGKSARARSLEKKYKNWFSSTPEVDKEFGPDPLLMRKTGNKRARSEISTYKERLKDDRYMDHAIDKIAQELSHFLSK
jgi:hypothetical protein